MKIDRPKIFECKKCKKQVGLVKWLANSDYGKEPQPFCHDCAPTITPPKPPTPPGIPS